MEILFKEDEWFYLIENDTIDISHIRNHPDIDLTNVPHLDDTEVLYHYKDITNNRIYPVYYEHDDRIVTYYEKAKDYDWIYTEADWEKDYTLINLKFLEDENNI